MRTENSGGDVLARGGAKAQFRAAGSKVTAEQWAAIWEPEAVEVEQKKGDIKEKD
jgi:hypothetical protein